MATVMHVRASACRGMAVYEQEGNVALAFLLQPVIHPDTGKIEGFFVSIPNFLASQTAFLSTDDIIHWGVAVRIRHFDLIGPLNERLRLDDIVQSGRTVLGQPIVTEGGRPLGLCFDVQFNTLSFQLEWIFPRRYWRNRTPIAAKEIIEVRSDDIVVKEPLRPIVEPTPVAAPLSQLV